MNAYLFSILLHDLLSTVQVLDQLVKHIREDYQILDMLGFVDVLVSEGYIQELISVHSSLWSHVVADDELAEACLKVNHRPD
jgi:hypothetical protein